MELVTEKPFKMLLDTVGKATIEKMRIASPFITSLGINENIIPYFKRRKTNIRIITNLSSFFIAVSLYDPISPLLNATEVLGERIQVRSHVNLHAKLFLMNDTHALVGSSNLTKGGIESNLELNWLLRNRKPDRNFIDELGKWFEKVWLEAGKNLNKKELLDLKEKWESNKARRAGFFNSILPTPMIGGDYWSNAKKIARQSRMKRTTVNNLLQQKETEQGTVPKNIENKLIFLREIGLISSYDEKWVIVDQSAADKFTDANQIATLLSIHIPLLPHVLKGVADIKRATYEDLGKELKINRDDPQLHAAVCWLEHLKFIKRDRKSKSHIFSILPGGRKYIQTI